MFRDKYLGQVFFFFFFGFFTEIARILLEQQIESPTDDVHIEQQKYQNVRPEDVGGQTGGEPVRAQAADEELGEAVFT